MLACVCERMCVRVCVRREEAPDNLTGEEREARHAFQPACVSVSVCACASVVAAKKGAREPDC